MFMNKKKISGFAFLALFVLMFFGCASGDGIPDRATLSKDALMDKIRGGWAGQTIGVCYGQPTEFRYLGRVIDDSIRLEWNKDILEKYFNNDDIYMDLTFVDVFDKKGLDATADDFAQAFAHAGYALWHANRAARYNILQGLKPPQTGYWENNPHADDIDFEIESDFSGLMSPGMPNTAIEIGDKIGHILNYGNGWYGGVYMGTMYSLAFICDDIDFIVSEAVKAIPQQSTFHQCMTQIIEAHEQNPDDWKYAWDICEKNWSREVSCVDGVDSPWNITALINSAYVTIGLLYGHGDFGMSMDIATRCGQDSDCNPSSVGGILGTMLGYKAIPEEWTKDFDSIADKNLNYTDISLNKACQLSFDQALQLIEKNGGKVGEDDVTIKCQTPQAVRFEESFQGHFPIEKKYIGKPLESLDEEYSFTGNGAVFMMRANYTQGQEDYIAQVEVTLDGKVVKNVNLPIEMNQCSDELYYVYKLPVGEHKVSFRWLNPDDAYKGRYVVGEMVTYSDRPAAEENNNNH
jgi:hypothetical protein